MLWGVWFNGVGMLAEGWVAIGPRSPELPAGRPNLPLVSYFGGRLNYGHTDKSPLSFDFDVAHVLARDWTRSFSGEYTARVLPALIRS